MSELEKKVRAHLKVIRDILDTDVIDTDIENVQNKALNLIQLAGLASECKGSARLILENKRLLSLSEIQDSGLPASIMSKKLDAMCANEIALYEYTDRINASISHSLDTLRSVLSLYKQELASSFFEPKNQM